MSDVLVVAPHADDETLGCGGTILRHIANGDKVHWLIMTSIAEDSGFSRQFREIRTREIDKVATDFGFSSVHIAPFCPAQLDTVGKAALIREVSSVIKNCEPDIVYLPFRGDVHSDHELVFDAVISSTKSFRAPSIRRICAYETLSETEFSVTGTTSKFEPNYWVNITDYLDAKVNIMRLYKSELGVHPFPRSEANIRALATYRGARAGVLAAEAFVLLMEYV